MYNAKEKKNGVKCYIQNGVIYPRIHIFITSRNQQGENTVNF